MDTLPVVWSCGGGTQSAAIAALICAGRLPKPDVSVMVDTEREKTSTWEYVNGVLVPALTAAGVTLHIVRKSEYATVDLWGGEDGRSLLLPVFTTQSGTLGKLPEFCSGEWKRRVVARFLKDKFGFSKWVTWLGMSTDELRRVRVKGENGPNHYPLVQDVPMRRADCYRFVTSEMGWPGPPSSACWMCSNMPDSQWVLLRDNHPDDFTKAVALDAEIRETDPHAFLHKSGRPLDEVDFDAQGALDFDGKGCDSGFCFV